MTETRKKDHKQYLLKLLESHDPNLLIPQLRIQNSWSINGGVKVIFFYVRHPTPLFRLKILHECIKGYLEKNGVSSQKTTLVGKELHKYQPKPILSLQKFKMNPKFVTGNVKHLYAWRLTFRAACCPFIKILKLLNIKRLRNLRVKSRNLN